MDSTPVSVPIYRYRRIPSLPGFSGYTLQHSTPRSPRARASPNSARGAVQGRFFRDQTPHCAIQMIDCWSDVVHRYNGGQENPENSGVTNNMVQITERAIGKVKEIMGSQDPAPSGLRISVVGGGCSGFSYSMAFENQPNILDKTYTYDGWGVFVYQASLLYLDGAEVDFVETLEGSGFKLIIPAVKSTCGCGSSFQEIGRAHV